MPMLSSIVELLKRERIPYTCFKHVPAYTAQEEAAVSHIQQRCWAKVVICIADEQPLQAVLPAHLDPLTRLALRLRARRVSKTVPWISASERRLSTLTPST